MNHQKCSGRTGLCVACNNSFIWHLLNTHSMLRQALLWNSEGTWTVCVEVPSSWLRLLETLWMSDVHKVLSSTFLLSSFRLTPVASFMESIHLTFGLPHSWRLLFSPAFSLNPCLFTVSPKKASFRFVIFVSSDVSGLICPRTFLFVFLVVQGIIHRVLLTPRFTWNPFFFFFPIGLLHWPTFASIHSNWEYEGTNDLSLGF